MKSVLHLLPALPPPGALARCGALLLALTAFQATSSQAAEEARETWVIDPSHSEVGFSVRHFFSKVPGRFGDFEGTVSWDRKDLTNSSVDVTIRAESIDTGNENRDDHLRNEDFFHVEEYPTIRFRSTRIRPRRGAKAVMEGELTMRGVTRPVSLEVDLLGSGPDLWGGTRAGFSARGVLDRQEFGVAWNKAVEGGGLALGNQVEIRLEIEAVRKAPEASR